MTATQKFLIRMKKRLIEKGLNFSDLAKRAGITESAISQGMTGKTRMKKITMDKIELSVKQLID